MKEFLDAAAIQNHPLRALRDFLDKEEALEKAKLHDQRRFVGYALEIGYKEVTIITCDPFKIAAGGIPRNSLLIMCPSNFETTGVKIPLHFTLLRVLDAAPTPLSPPPSITIRSAIFYRSFSVTIVSIASIIPKIQKRATIFASCIPSFW